MISDVRECIGSREVAHNDCAAGALQVRARCFGKITFPFEVPNYKLQRYALTGVIR